MTYSENLIKQFRGLYREKYNQEISVNEANIEISRLANLVKVMLKEEVNNG